MTDQQGAETKAGKSRGAMGRGRSRGVHSTSGGPNWQTRRHLAQ